MKGWMGGRASVGYLWRVDGYNAHEFIWDACMGRMLG